MTNFDTARDALETSLNSAGSAMAEHEKWQQSLEAQINNLKASWQGLSQAFLSSNFLHGALEGVIGLVDGLTKLIDIFGAFPTLMGTVATGFSLLKNGGLFKTFNNDLKGFSNHIGIANHSFAELMKSFNSANTGGFKGIISGFKSMFTTLKDPLSDFDRSAIAEYNKLVDQGTASQENIAKAMQGTSTAAQNMVQSANGSKVALTGVKTASIGAKIGMLGAKVAAIALNAALTMGISLAIQFVVEGLMKIFNASNDLAEKVDELISKFEEEHKELQKLKGDLNTDNESSMISRYEKLSKGVDGLGKNVSLTAEEYSEYQNIVNQIADQFPNLINGYDDTGMAMLSCKDDVEQLTNAYQDLIFKQNQAILTGQNGKDIQNNWEKTLKQANGYDIFEKFGNAFAWIPSLFGADLSTFDMKTSTADMLADFLDPQKKSDALRKIDSLAWDSYERTEIIQALQTEGLDVGLYTDISKFLENATGEELQKIQNALDNYYNGFDEKVAEYKTKATALLSNAFDVRSEKTGMNYGNISEELQNIAYQTVNSLDFNFLNDLSAKGISIDQWVKDMLNSLNSLSSEANKKIETGFELQTKFNGGDISYGQYINQLQETIDFIDSAAFNVPEEVKNQIKLSLNSEDVLADYNALVNDLKNIGFEDAAIDSFLSSLSAEEFSAAMKIVPNLDKGTTIDEIQAMIDEQLAQEFKFDIKIQTEGIEALNTALAESRSAAGMTAESIEFLKARYEDLDGFNAAALFEKTANGIRLNSDELSRLEEQYVNTNKLEIDKNLNTLVEKYQDVNNELKTNTSLTSDERKELERSKESLADKIDELSTLASQYDGLTSAFTKWQNAMSGAEEGDNYDSVFENLEAMNELDDKGLVGTDKYKAFAQLFSYEDLSSASIDKIGKAFDKGYKKAERYFTEGQKGSKNFLNDLHAINSEWAHINKDGVWEVDINAEEAAKKLGISVEAVLLILDKLKDYGIKVEVEDTSVDNLKTKIQQTEAKLKELGQSPVDINVDIEASSSNLGKIETEIEKAKSKIAEINKSSVSPEVKTAQLEDARAKLEALIQKKQEASQPAFMSLNTSQVNASLVDALEKVQSYQKALNELNELKELKSAGIAIDDSEISAAEEKLDGFAKAIQGLDGDVKVAIGLEEDGSIDSIHKAFEEGKVKIDANTDPALNKIEQLAENVERIEDKDVTINVTVNGLDQVKELNKQIDLATDIKGDIDKLSEYVENAKELNKLGNNITSYVTAEVKGNVIDTKEYKLDNLKVFGESAKEVKELGTFTSKVTADVEGNVIDTREGKLDNLKVFTDSAKDIKEFEGNIISNITANTLGSVFTEKERNIDNLEVFVDSAKGIKEIEGNITSNITANTLGSVFENKSEEKYIDNLKTFIESSKGIKDIEGDIVSNITANTLGSVFENKNEDKYIDNLKTYVDSAKGIKDIEGNIISSITANTLGSVFESKNEDKYIDNLKTYVESAKGIKDIEGNIVSNITANTLGSVFENKNEEKYINNLKTFVDSAKGIKEIEGDIVSNITANTLGSVFESKNEDKYIDNLKTFVDSAKGIKEIEGDIVSNITANTLGSVFTDKERTIDNLKVFVESAKGIKGIEGDIVSNITANTLGSVFEDPERETDNLKVFIESAKGIKDIEGDIVSNITANTLGSVFTNKERSIDNLKVYTESAKGIKEIEGNISSSITADVNGNVFNKLESKIDNLGVFVKSAKGIKDIKGDISSKVTADVQGNVLSTAESKIDNLGVFAENAKQLKGLGNFSSSVSANATGNVVEGEGASSRLSSLTEFKSIVSGMTNQNVTVSVTAKVDSENVNAAIDLLKKVSDSGVFKDYNATVQVGAKIAKIDDTVVQNYKAPSKDSTVKYSVDPESSVYTWTAPSKDGVVNYSASVEALTDAQKHKTGTITYKANIVGFGGVVNGTANANGSAFANGTSGKAFKQGDWGVKKTTTALTGELGQELVVYKNRWYTVGDNGAEFATIPKGAIVFNHKQTEELFANGKVTSDGGRGKAFASGTAFEEGSGMPKDETSKKADPYDWIEVLLTRLERAIDNFTDTVDDEYSSWTERKNALYGIDKDGNPTGALVKNQELINKLDSAKTAYENAADKVELSESIKAKVRNGTLDPNDSSITEEQSEKIQEYRTLWENYLDTCDKYTEAQRTQLELQSKYFDMAISKYDGLVEGYEHKENMIDEYIAQAEAKGHLVSGEYYKELIKNNDEKIIPDLIQQREEMIAARDSLNLDEDSEEYINMSNEINAVTQDIEAARTQTLEWQNEIRQLNWDNLDLAREKISQLNDEADFFIELMSNDKLFDDNGQMNGKGLTTMALHFANRDVYKGKAQEYADEIDSLNNQIKALEDKDDYDQNLIDRRDELLEKQRECILSYEQEEDAIKDLISEGYDKQLDALQERIDLYNESVDSAKDLYDYERNISEQVQNIAALEKQLRAYEGFNDDETRSTVQKLKVELEKANADLEETQYDRFISDQSALLDNLYLQYEEALNSRLDNDVALLQEKLREVNDSLGVNGAINTTLSGLVDETGVKMSEEFSKIWTEGGKGAEGVTLLNNISGSLTEIKDKVVGKDNSMADKSDKEAKENIKKPTTTTSATSNHSSGSGGSKPSSSSSTGNKSTGGDGKVKIGDKVKFLSGKYYYDSQGVNPAGSKNHGKYVYITNVNNKKWATHPIHISTGKKLGSGDLGWLKKNQISGYATGKKNFLDNEIAWTQENGKEFIVRPSDGAILTPIAKGDSVLNAQASGNIWNMANSPAEFIKDNLNLGATNVPNNANVQNNYSQHIDNVVFRMDNVKNYDEMLAAMKSDKNFDRLIKAMTVDQIAGKSSLAKNKSIR